MRQSRRSRPRIAPTMMPAKVPPLMPEEVTSGELSSSSAALSLGVKVTGGTGGGCTSSSESSGNGAEAAPPGTS
eukprot:449207-Pelagomonas_calceolata.AAC.2